MFSYQFGAMIDDFSQILKKGVILLERVTLINPVNLNLLPSLNIVQCRCILCAKQNNISSFKEVHKTLNSRDIVNICSGTVKAGWLNTQIFWEEHKMGVALVRKSLCVTRYFRYINLM